MISARKIAAFMLLAVLISGCKHKTPVAPPVAAQAPPLPPKPIAQVAALPPVPQPETPKVGAPGSDQPPPQPEQKPKRPTHHRPKPVTPGTDQGAKEPAKETPPAGATQQVASGEAPESSPIGQLSTAGDSSGTPSRHDILDTIASTEKGLNDLKRTLTPAEQETVTQIRTFLSKAKQALTQDDLDGAHTLATKAKVLLEELTKS